MRSHCLNLKLILWIVLFAAHVPVSFAQDVLTLGVHPYRSITILTEKFSPLTDYLAQELECKVELRVGSSYQEHIDTVGRDQIDIAYFGPVGYVSMVDQYGPKQPLAVQVIAGKASFSGILFTREDNHATTLSELGGGEVAFVEPHSTMGFMLPTAVLLKENQDVINQKRYQFLQTHENVALGVLSGDFIAGAVKEGVYHAYKNRGLKQLAVTPPVSEHLFVARNGLAEDIVKKLKKALINLNHSPSGVRVMQAIKPTINGFLPITDNHYDSLRKTLAQLKKQGLIK